MNYKVLIFALTIIFNQSLYPASTTRACETLFTRLQAIRDARKELLAYEVRLSTGVQLPCVQIEQQNEAHRKELQQNYDTAIAHLTLGDKVLLGSAVAVVVATGVAVLYKSGQYTWHYSKKLVTYLTPKPKLPKPEETMWYQAAMESSVENGELSQGPEKLAANMLPSPSTICESHLNY